MGSHAGRGRHMRVGLHALGYLNLFALLNRHAVLGPPEPWPTLEEQAPRGEGRPS